MTGARPHVLMTADAVGGVWTYALDLGRGLAEAGVRVTLVVPGPEPDGAQAQAAAEAGLELEPLGGALDWTAAHKGEMAAVAMRLLQLSTRLRPDLVHLNSPALGAFGPFQAPVLAVAHSCVRTWWAAVKGDAPLPDDLAWRAALVELGYENAAALAAPSRAFAEATRAAYGLITAPYTILNGRNILPSPSMGEGSGMGVDAGLPWTIVGGGVASDAIFGERIASTPPPPPSRGRELHIADTRKTILTAGRLWDEGKDVATLDRAIARSGLEGSAAGPFSSPTGQTISLHHLQPLGRLSDADLRARLAARPIFVSPSLYEPFGLSVLEAAQAGCPLVLSDIATFRELWDGAALFFPPGDDAALAVHLARLADDAALRERLGEAAAARAGRYTLNAMTDATLRLYAALSPTFAGRERAA